MHIGLESDFLDLQLPETEQRYPSAKGLDLKSNTEILRIFLESQSQAVKSIEAAIPVIGAAAADIANKLAHADSRLIHAGAGSSGLLAMQDAMEMNPTFDWPLTRQIFLMAGGDQARLLPIGPEEDNAAAGKSAASEHNICSNDVVIAVAASGTTPFSVDVLSAAKERGALTVAIVNNAETAMLDIADHGIYVRSGPEVIAGSTRLAAGTAQKAALGMLSSLVMLRLGHVVDGFMVNMVANNSKLHDRAARIVSSIAECSQQSARNALEQSSGSIKQAILIALGETAPAAVSNLEKSKGNLRQSMQALM